MREKRKAQPGAFDGLRLHPLVEATRRALETAEADTYGMLVNYGTPHLEMTASDASFRRAILFWQGVIEECEKQRWRVAVEKDPENGRFCRTILHLQDERLILRLRESYRQVPYKPTPEETLAAKRSPYPPSWPRVGFAPSGVFEFTAKGSDAGWDLVRVRDGKTRIEESLAWLVPALQEAAEKNRTFREERTREREEARRLEERRRQAEERHAAEERRRSELLQEAERWHKSQRLRQYLVRVRRAAKGVEEGTSLHAWLAWAESVAAELDPLPRRAR